MSNKKQKTKEIWSVEDRRDGPSIWTRVGTAFENADGTYQLRLSAYPVNGRLHMRDPAPSRTDANDSTN